MRSRVAIDVIAKRTLRVFMRSSGPGWHKKEKGPGAHGSTRRGHSWLASSVDPECEEGAALRDQRQICGLGHRCRADRAELVAHVETGGNGKTDPAAYARPDRHVLMAVDLVGDRIADDAGGEFA